MEDDEKLMLNSKGRFKIKNCPCGKSNKDGKFVPFGDQTSCGYCHACGETILPNNELSRRFNISNIKSTEKRTFYILPEYLEKSKRKYEENNFVLFLVNRYGVHTTEKILYLYHIGTSKLWDGATIFWQIDQEQKIRTGKIMLYSYENCKRVKTPRSCISWIHNELKISNDLICKCLFGEHLVTLFPDKPIAIVESEKTAIIASQYFPKYNWIATGGIGNLNYQNLKFLKNKIIVLFPDLGAYHFWFNKLIELRKWFNIRISDYLEKNANINDRNENYDLADYLLQYDLTEFLK